ncbi:MAG: acetylglutamate kinase, partial [Campylobacterales bacterium]|nr:acetylglutamate kinase [Campylobacterales bacterium]
MQKKTKTVETLLDAIPFIKQFFGETVVIKYGGSAQEDPKLKAKFAEDILLLYLVGIKPVVVHGGGKNITNLHKDLQVETEFRDGVRVTSKESMRIAEMVLSGEINNEIVSLINHHGAKAIGISGKDANCVMAEPLKEELGYTGKITDINAKVIQKLIDDKFIPVIAPIAASSEIGEPGFNINADTMASEIAVALKAKKVIFLTDIVGVLDDNKKLLSTLTYQEIEDLKEKGIIHGGMIPKVEACTNATENGVAKAHIIDGRVEHSMLLEIFTS